MSNIISNVPYDQAPHIVINHPETNPEHVCIMIHFYKVLKDKTKIVYTNETLSQNCKISLRTIERRIKELQKMGFIRCTGRGYNRRIELGLLFNNTVTMAVVHDKKLNNPAKFANTTAKNDGHNRHGGGDSKPYINPSIKENISFSSLNHWELKELEICLERKFPLNSEFKYLQPLLDKVSQNE